MKVFRLHFKTPLHVTSELRGLESAEEIVRSDTLLSALLSLWRRFYDDDPADIVDKIRLSSAFPFIGETMYFPRPANLRISGGGEAGKEKERKKVEYLSAGLFKLALEGEVDSRAFNPHNGIFACTPEELPDAEVIPTTLRTRPRVTIDRSTGESTPFNFSEVEFGPNCGLWFAAELDGVPEERFVAALNLLGDEGLGGDRSVGMGLFEASEGNTVLPETSGDGHLILSLFCPSEKELARLDLENSYYRLIERGGWITGTSLRRVRTRFFAEGSCFRSNALLEGRVLKALEKMPELGLHYDVLRSGRPISVPIKMEGVE